MTPPKVNKETVGNFVAQFFTANDPSGVAYDEKTKIRMFGARYELGTSSGGLPILTTVADTVGPIVGLFPWKPKSPRTLAQLSFVFAAKITSTGPLKATPVSTGSGSGWTVSTDLDPIEVYTSDGVAPELGAFGLVVVGTELRNQKPLFFQGGSGGGGTSVRFFKIMENLADGTYKAVEFDRPRGTIVAPFVEATEATWATLQEDNLALAVEPGTYVRATDHGGTLYFHYPLGCDV